MESYLVDMITKISRCQSKLLEHDSDKSTLDKMKKRLLEEICIEHNKYFAPLLWKALPSVSYDNHVVSPYALNLTLSMLADGAAQSTALLLERYNHIPEWRHRAGYRNIVRGIHNNDQTQLRVCCYGFIQSWQFALHKLEHEFVELLRKHYLVWVCNGVTDGDSDDDPAIIYHDFWGKKREKHCNMVHGQDFESNPGAALADMNYLIKNFDGAPWSCSHPALPDKVAKESNRYEHEHKP